MTYEEKAENLAKTGFCMYGVGNFDLSVESIAYILALIEKEDFEELYKFYKKLSAQELS
jgi:hypothetical protein